MTGGGKEVGQVEGGEEGREERKERPRKGGMEGRGNVGNGRKEERRE